jgi:hypothetical protein
LIRPFAESAEVQCRGYSGPLQRTITDFGADQAFARIAEKLQEHYGIQVPTTMARAITEKHGAAMLAGEPLQSQVPGQPGVKQLIAEIDGSLVPIVQTAPLSGQLPCSDKRKNRRVEWKQARLSLVRRDGSVTPKFAATLGSAEQAGAQLLDLALRAGMGSQSRVHGLGDGADWIYQQVQEQFAEQASYLIDFYHLCDYLAAAAPHCGDNAAAAWLQQHQTLMKENQTDRVLDDLAPYLEREAAAGDDAPVKACYRYIDNRPGQFNYQAALAAGLPIGSGEIESAHRYVIQERLKIAGAWWRMENASKMLALRVLRANGQWQHYWKESYKVAA